MYLDTKAEHNDMILAVVNCQTILTPKKTKKIKIKKSVLMNEA